MNDWLEVIKERMKAAGINQTDLARMVGVTPGAVGHWFNLRRNPSLEEINKMLDAVGSPRLQIPGTDLQEVQLAAPFRRAPILGTAQLGPDGYWDALETADGWIDVPTTDREAYALRVRGDSMSPAIRDGWCVWCLPGQPPVPGEYVMVKLKDGQCMVKELLYINAEAVSLMSINSAYGRTTIPRSDIEQIHYVGGIVPGSRIKVS